MVSTTAVGLMVVWILALFCSVTLGGWIHLLPAAAVPLLLFRVLRHEPPSDDYRKWQHALARRRR